MAFWMLKIGDYLKYLKTLASEDMMISFKCLRMYINQPFDFCSTPLYKSLLLPHNQSSETITQ